MTVSTPFAVIIPAHNEEAVIARCLRSVLADAPGAEAMQIIVAANGCTDRTVEIARAVAPHALVLDLPVGSKIGAINAANRAATLFPRIFLDADVECGYFALAALAEALRQPGAMAAAPAIRLDLSRCNWAMRAYYRAWMKQPYAKAGKGGAGCYALSQAALERVGDFPPIIGDDLWIHTRFPEGERRYLAADNTGRPVFSVVHPPSTAHEQIRVEARRWIGTIEVKRDYPTPYIANQQGQGPLAMLRTGTSPGDLVVYLAMKLSARLLAKWRIRRGRANIWSRDLTSRAGANAGV
jgi:hypothetical protein